MAEAAVSGAAVSASGGKLEQEWGTRSGCEIAELSSNALVDRVGTSGYARARLQVARLMEVPSVERGIVALVLGYTILVFVQMLTMDEDGVSRLNSQQERIIAAADLSVLSIFLAEILLKIFAYGSVYLANPLHLVDAVFVALSMAMSLLELVMADGFLSRFTRLRAVLRLVRILIMFRKVRQTSNTLKAKVTGLGYNLTSPAEEVIHMLMSLQEYPRLSSVQCLDIKWAISAIDSGRLYEPMTDGDGLQDATSNAWLVNGSQSATRQCAASAPTKTREARELVPIARRSVLRTSTPATRQSLADTEKAFRGSMAIIAEGDDAEEEYAQGPSEFHPASFCGSLETVLLGPLELALQKIDEWNFDVVSVHKCTGGHALRVVAAKIFHQWECSKGLDRDRLHNFVHQIQTGYFASNPYHNSLHATDVAQTVHWMLAKADVVKVAQLQGDEVVALLLAAIVHDYEHPGVNNGFCAKTRHPLAVRYNDASVLEMHHVAAAFKLLTEWRCNFLAGSPDATYWAIREVMVSSVLATDISKHFEELNKLKSRVAADEFLKHGESAVKADKLLALNVVLHACDIANPAKELEMYLYWTERVLAEYFAQGDQEKSLGLPVSMLMDRKSTNIAKCQVGFIDILVFPLYDELQKVFAPLHLCCDFLESNKRFWRQHVDLMEEEMTSGRQRMPSLHGKPEDQGDGGVRRVVLVESLLSPPGLGEQCKPISTAEEEVETDVQTEPSRDGLANPIRIFPARPWHASESDEEGFVV
mmetsp:Transcript_13688/g.30675  ORF Transcript_13688/g.30675 Transcript_13688/m.30675 type:complete len:761 (+) Transcript_13688:127-2409(+)